MNDLSTWNSILAGGATSLIAFAAALLVLAVVVPPARRAASLPATIFALVGAISARFTEAHTIFGDSVFRSSTVPWSLALAVTAAAWWFLAGSHNHDTGTGTGAGAGTGTGTGTDDTHADGATTRADAHGGLPAARTIPASDSTLVATGTAATAVEAPSAKLRTTHELMAPVRVYEARRKTPSERRADIGRLAFGVTAVLIAVGTFLTATGLVPLVF